MLRAIMEYELQVLLLENAVAGSDGYRARLQISEAHYCPSVIKALAARYNNIQLRHLDCHDLAMRGSGVRGPWKNASHNLDHFRQGPVVVNKRASAVHLQLGVLQCDCAAMLNT